MKKLLEKTIKAMPRALLSMILIIGEKPSFLADLPVPPEVKKNFETMGIPPETIDVVRKLYNYATIGQYTYVIKADEYSEVEYKARLDQVIKILSGTAPPPPPKTSKWYNMLAELVRLYSETDKIETMSLEEKEKLIDLFSSELWDDFSLSVEVRLRLLSLYSGLLILNILPTIWRKHGWNWADWFESTAEDYGDYWNYWNWFENEEDL